MLLLISVAVTITHNVTNTHASPQNQDRILKQRSWPNEPVKIKLVTSKKGAIKLGETFSDDDDWFRGLTLKIENKSDKAITYIALSVMGVVDFQIVIQACFKVVGRIEIATLEKPPG